MNPCIMRTHTHSYIRVNLLFQGLRKLSVTTINLVKTTLQTVKAACMFKNLYFCNIKIQSSIIYPPPLQWL